jgi:predicted Zn-dependent protease
MRWYVLFALVMCIAPACGGAQDRRLAAPAGDPLTEVSSRALFERGVSLALAGDYIRAEQYLSAARDRGHAPAEVVPKLIEVCVAGSRYHTALAHATSYLEQTPSDWSLRLLVASLHLAVQNPASARRELARVVEEHPGEPTAHYLLATVSSDHMGDPTVAAHHYRRYLELSPDGDHAYTSRAWLRAHAALDPAAAPDRAEQTGGTP